MKSSFAWRYANARKGKFQFRLRQDTTLDRYDEDGYGARGTITRLGSAVYSSPIQGDLNDDGDVDAADYVAWRNGLGTGYGQVDYDVWRARFGQTAASSADLSFVPEPFSWRMLTMAGIGLSLYRRCCLI
jgi:hypothetical protein